MSTTEASEPTDFATAATPSRGVDGEWQLSAGPDWAQGRTLFGGLVAANVASAMTKLVEPDLQLRTLSLVMAGPINPGTAQIQTTLDRTGSATAFTAATVSQAGSVRTRAQAVFARTRDSAIEVIPQMGALDNTFDESPLLPYLEGIVPVCMQHFEIRWGLGDFPFSGSQRTSLGGYCRHQEPALGIEAVIGLLDCWPPAVLPMAAGPAAASTVSWTAHILREPPADPTAWYSFRYDTIAAEQGYATIVGTLSHDGDVVAWTEQLVAVYA